jgi:hypothetical protein
MMTLRRDFAHASELMRDSLPHRASEAGGPGGPAADAIARGGAAAAAPPATNGAAAGAASDSALLKTLPGLAPAAGGRDASVAGALPSQVAPFADSGSWRTASGASAAGSAKDAAAPVLPPATAWVSGSGSAGGAAVSTGGSAGGKKAAKVSYAPGQAEDEGVARVLRDSIASPGGSATPRTSGGAALDTGDVRISAVAGELEPVAARNGRR